MPPERFGTLINLTGFGAGFALYAMLLAMVLRNPEATKTLRRRWVARIAPRWARGLSHEPLLATTAALGLAWNLGAFALYGLEGLGFAQPPAFAGVLAFVALGFLPAVVVHAALRPGLADRQWLAVAVVATGYTLSAVAGILQVAAAVSGDAGHSGAALRLLMAGFGGIVVLLAAGARRDTRARRMLLLAALAVFAVSALHLAEHEALRDSWWVELVGHHASIPLALAILYQDYPFALADLFLKRALVVVLVLALVLAGYAGAIWVLPSSLDPLVAIALFALAVASAVTYPFIRRGVHRFVDNAVLKRADYAALHAAIAEAVSLADTPEDVLSETCRSLVPALAARETSCWRLDGGAPQEIGEHAHQRGDDHLATITRAYGEWSPFDPDSTVSTNARKTEAVIVVPTAEPPRYVLAIGALAGGRRLWSGDRTMLVEITRTAARRIDLIRLEGERLERRVRETTIRQLATEAELRALRAQINPHFLFNALTTLGYLIQTSPATALEQLLKLTGLLRRVLRSEGEFTTLGYEVELVQLYLDLERARFEERLSVKVDVGDGLRDLPVPAFVLQPLVENAVKHGIAPTAAGGLVEIRATLEALQDGTQMALVVTVRDTGAGVRNRGQLSQGIGLRNLQRRLYHHYGDAGWVRLAPSGEKGTVVTLRLPVDQAAHGIGRPISEVVTR